MRVRIVTLLVIVFVFLMATAAFAGTPSVIGTDGGSIWKYRDLADSNAKYEGGYLPFESGQTGKDGVADDYADPHGGYDTATNKCKVCHAVHRAEGAYYLLRADSQDDACDYCHVGGSAHSSKPVYDNGGKGTQNGHTIGASTYIPDSSVSQWTEQVTLRTSDANGNPLTETINVRAYDEQKNDMFRFARHHGHSMANGTARRNYVPVGPLALRCMNCHQVHNATYQTWQPISLASMDNTGRYKASTRSSYKLLKQFPSGSFFGAEDSYGQIALTHISIVPETTLTAGYNFESTRNLGGNPSTIGGSDGTKISRTVAGVTSSMQMASPLWVAQGFDHQGYAAPGERSNPSAVNGAALSVWCADCHNLNIGGRKILANPELGFKAHTERTHPAPYVGAFNGPAQCYSCHRSDLPRMNTGDPCSLCHYGTGAYRENRYDVASAEYIASDFPHSGEAGDYKLLGSYSIDLSTMTILEDTTVGENNLDAVCIRCHNMDERYHSASGGGEPADTHAIPAEYAGCNACHPGADVTEIHANTPNGCGSCHDSETYSTDCATCHPEKLQPHGAMPEDHTVGAPCALSGCHDTNVAAIHAAGPGCSACHGSGKTPSLVCSSCHTGNLHPTADHTSSVTCDSCHSVTNLLTIHGDQCQLCHSTPVDSSFNWNQSCEQSGCHAAPLHPGTFDHGGDHGEGGDCWSCHEYGWSCTDCHGHEYDRTPPTTTSNVQPTYDGTAVITLTPSDPQVYGAPPGGWGVKSTFYQVDGGPIQVGTVITIPAPATGTDVHTIEFWSLDNRCNTEEPHNKASFFVNPAPPDTTAPTTTSNARASYLGSASIALTPSDTGGSGVAHTYYKVDGGGQTEGTTINVAGPSSGSASHAIEFWSVDGAGNEESPHKTASFTISASDTIAPTTTSNALASYTGPATITLTPSDTGGSGVAHTYYKVDGGAQTEGITINVAAPATGSASHSVEFWSVDGSGNIETPHKTASFVVNAPPVTTGTIRLVWGDNDTSGYIPYGGSWATWTVRSGGPTGPVVATGSGFGGTGWTGIDDVTVVAQATPYYVYVDWYDSDWDSYGPTVFGAVYVTAPGQVVTLHY